MFDTLTNKSIMVSVKGRKDLPKGETNMKFTNTYLFKLSWSIALSIKINNALDLNFEEFHKLIEEIYCSFESKGTYTDRYGKIYNIDGTVTKE